MIVSQLRTTGVNDSQILDAIRAVPREIFVEEDRKAVAYADRGTPLGNGRTLMPPEVFGKLLESALPRKGERALVIGGASGYAAAVLAGLGLDVTLLESDPLLVVRAKALVGGQARVVEGDLQAGTKKGAPFDIILIDGAVEEIPPVVIKLLGDGGRLVTVRIDSLGLGRAVLGIRSGESFGLKDFADATSVERLPGFARPRAFQF